MSKIWSSLGLAVLGIAILVGAAAAATNADTAVNGVVASTTVVDVKTDTINFGTFTLGDNTHTTTGDSFINVTTNQACYVYAVEASSDGKMASHDTPATTLTQRIQVGIESATLAYMSSTPAKVSDQISTNTNSQYDATFKQTVLATDAIADDYEMTLTFSYGTS